MGYFNQWIDHVAESFSNLFNLDPDPDLSERDNVLKVIDQTAMVAAITAIVMPIPAADFVVLTPIQAKMALHIGRIKGFEVNQERAEEIVTEIFGVLGMSLTAHLLIVSVAKLIPVVGSVLTWPLIFAATWSIGKVVDYYFDCLRAGNKPSSETIKDLFAAELKVGKQRGEQLDKEDLKRKANDLRRKVEARGGAEMRTEARMDGSGPSDPAAPGRAAPNGKQKIRITLDDRAERDRNPAVDQDDLPPQARKTIGPLGVKVSPKGEPAPEPKAEPREPMAKKTMGEATPPAGTPEAPAATPPEVVPVTSMAPEPIAPLPGSAGAEPSALIDQLERLAKLKELGVLTDDEYAEAKRKLLS